MALSACNSGGSNNIKSNQSTLRQNIADVNTALSLEKEKYQECQLKNSFNTMNEYLSCLEQLNTQQQSIINLIHSDNEFSYNKVNSFYFYPTQMLPDDQRQIHRIWMGGSPSDNGKKAIQQWVNALSTVSHNLFTQPLWVWNSTQLEKDPDFVLKRQNLDNNQIGCYKIGEDEIPVYSIEKLIVDTKDQKLEQTIKQYHDSKKYALLSDYLRGVILKQYGGMYVDLDIAPTKGITMFLAKPELPGFKTIDTMGTHSVSMYALDYNGATENGLLVSLKNDEQLAKFVKNATNIIINTPPATAETQIIFEQWMKDIRQNALPFGITDNIFKVDKSFMIYGNYLDPRGCLDDLKTNHFDVKIFGNAQIDFEMSCYIDSIPTNALAIAVQQPGFNSWDSDENTKQQNKLYEDFVQSQYLNSSEDRNYWLNFN